MATAQIATTAAIAATKAGHAFDGMPDDCTTVATGPVPTGNPCGIGGSTPCFRRVIRHVHREPGKRELEHELHVDHIQPAIELEADLLQVGNDLEACHIMEFYRRSLVGRYRR